MKKPPKTNPKTTELAPNAYDGMALIADPIHSYASFTVPTERDPSEKTEKDLIDSPWMQRMRRIYQLQSARWVYPAAEHTRFQHSLGTMHVAGEFARQLYPSLKEVCKDIPSFNYIEELLRVTGLLHDVGHGPFGHFFDQHYLSRWNLTHEMIGQQIIVRALGQTISRLKRGPSGPFARGEKIDPAQVAYLIKMPEAGESPQKPRWLGWLRQLFSGIYTVDNLDYVQRDAYMTGFSLDMIDMPRLRYYTFFTPDGITLHSSGISALRRFLNARLNLYSNVYFHRTTRALDLHLQEIFAETLLLLYPDNPLTNLDAYLSCDEWSLYNKMQDWLCAKNAQKRRLAAEWQKIHAREVKWKMAFSAEISVDTLQRGTEFLGAQNYETKIRSALPAKLQKLPFRVDVAMQDPRPLNPIAEPGKRINIFNPVTGRTSAEPLADIYRFIPARVRHFRVFALSHDHDEALAKAADTALCNLDKSIPTNV